MLKFSTRSQTFLFSALFLLFAVQGLYLAFHNSLTNDEPFEITGGYYYWTKGDVVTSRMQPPVAAALQTLPLLFFHLDRPHGVQNEDERAYRFFFESNLQKLWDLTLIPRVVSLLFGLGVGILLFFLARRESFVFFLAVLGLWAMEPNLIAHSAIAKSDMILTFFLFASVLAYERALTARGWKGAFFAGILTGIAVTTKVTALSLGLVYGGLEVLRIFENKKKTRFLAVREVLVRWGWIISGVLVWIGLIYLPGTLLLPDHRCPYAYFMDKILMGWRISQKGWAYYYFLGKTSDFSHVLYLPMTLLFKTTLPFLILLVLGLFVGRIGKVKAPVYEWLVPLVYCLSILPAANMGIRIMLPAFPFLILVAGRGAAWMWERVEPNARKTFRVVLAVLPLFLVLSISLHFPNYLSYANEILSPDQKPYFLADADLDWGQDHLRLCDLAREKGWTHVKLALFAGVDPRFYGLDWSPWTRQDLQGPQPGWTYLVDTSFFQLGPAYFPETALIAKGWMGQRKPTGKLGDTWSYYEFPGTVQPDPSPPIHSCPVLRYYWRDNSRVFY